MSFKDNTSENSKDIIKGRQGIQYSEMELAYLGRRTYLEFVEGLQFRGSC